MTTAHLYMRLSLCSVLLMLLVTLAGQVKAADYREAISCCSKHLVEGDYNEFNPGYGREYGTNSWTAGWSVTINSHDSLALYGDIQWKPLHLGKLRAGVGFVCALGYDGNKIGCVAPLPVVEYQHNEKVAAELLITDVVITLRIKLKKGILGW